jgi:hypothetical protein
MLCDGNDPGASCQDFMMDVHRKGVGYNFQGEAERKNKVNFDLSSGDITKMDGSKTYLPDGCNACRLTSLVTNVQLIRFTTKQSTLDNTTQHWFEIGFGSYSTTVNTNFDGAQMKTALEKLPSITRVNAVKRRSTNTNIKDCAQAQADFEATEEGMTCNPIIPNDDSKKSVMQIRQAS